MAPPLRRCTLKPKVMTLQHFNTLSQHIQHRKILLNGVCIAYRNTEESQALLFQLSSFYVEVFFNRDGDEVLYTRSFDNNEELDPYLESINLACIV